MMMSLLLLDERMATTCEKIEFYVKWHNGMASWWLNIKYCKYIVWLAERSDRDSEYIFIFCRYVLVNIFIFTPVQFAINYKSLRL